MSNVEDHENKSKSRSSSPNKLASQRKSNSRSPLCSKSGTRSPSRNGHRSKSCSKSRSRSCERKHSHRNRSRRSGSRRSKHDHKNKSKSRSKSASQRKSNSCLSLHSKSGTCSPSRNRNRSKSHSKSRSRSRSYSRKRKHSHRNRSHRSGSRRIKHENSKPNRCLGIFGLSQYTTESHLYDIFSKYGAIERVLVIIDAKTRRSRGFGFAYYKNYEDAVKAKDECSGLEIDRHKIRVDFSLTHRPHTPTPGVYMGCETKRRSFGRQRYDRGYRGSRYDRERSYHDYYGGRYGGYGRSHSRGKYRDDRSPPSYYKARPYHTRSHSRSYSPREESV